MSSGRSIDRNRPIYLYTHEKPTENPAVSFRHGCRRVVTENGSSDKGKPLFRWLEISSWGRSFFTLVIAGAIVLTPGCTSSQEQARSQALDGLRASHEGHLGFAEDILETTSSPEGPGRD